MPLALFPVAGESQCGDLGIISQALALLPSLFGVLYASPEAFQAGLGLQKNLSSPGWFGSTSRDAKASFSLLALAKYSQAHGTSGGSMYPSSSSHRNSVVWQSSREPLSLPRKKLESGGMNTSVIHIFPLPWRCQEFSGILQEEARVSSPTPTPAPGICHVIWRINK